MVRPLDLLGAKFGRLTIIEKVDSCVQSGRSYTTWKCVCDCGNTTSARTALLMNGHKQSCGCLSIESRKKNATRHGLYGTGVYVSWRSMINRCMNSKLLIYARYGGRGIKICDRWMVLENFIADMGERPAGTSIDRIDNNGNYEPGNCRWATVNEQNENRRSTRWIEHNGCRLSVTGWARKLGIHPSTLRESLAKNPIDTALRSRSPKPINTEPTGVNHGKAA